MEGYLIEHKTEYISSEFKKVVAEIQKIIPFFNLDDFYFAGGCLYSLWQEKEIKDYDIFCTNKKALKKLKDYIKLHPNIVNFTTENAYSINKYQFIIKHIGNAKSEVGKFDFKHNCYWYDNNGIHDLYGWDYIDSNQLVYNSGRARDVLNIITRIPKFVSRGMEISQSEILDILDQGTKPMNYFSERKNIKMRKNKKEVY